MQHTKREIPVAENMKQNIIQMTKDIQTIKHVSWTNLSGALSPAMTWYLWLNQQQLKDHSEDF